MFDIVLNKAGCLIEAAFFFVSRTGAVRYSCPAPCT